MSRKNKKGKSRRAGGKENTPSPEVIDKKIKEMYAVLHSIKGDKILTLVLPERTQQFDMHKDGLAGYGPEHDLLFRAMLARAFMDKGVLMVREFTNMKSPTETRLDGTPLPIKRVCSAFIRAGKWTGLTKEEVKDACQTGGTERSVMYCNFPILPVWTDSET